MASVSGNRGEDRRGLRKKGKKVAIVQRGSREIESKVSKTPVPQRIDANRKIVW
jgi:hypothetical protein